MCGIAGVIDIDAGLERADELVAIMTDSLAHRGPDDAGLLVDDGIVLGHRRLAIIDLSPSGHQPMSTPDGDVWLVFNGEIYNYVELRAELQAEGLEFTTSTDTEVLLQAYVAWGTGMLERLNGMFAFALWDRPRGRTLLVRDRFGVKPLYYMQHGGRLRFASEIKALLVDPTVPRLPNHRRIVDFLADGMQDHTAETMFDSVLQIRPGHYLELRTREPVPEPTRWYTPLPAARSSLPVARIVRGALESAVRLRLRSDVPVGVSLSGGMDSSSVLALASSMRRAEGDEAPATFSARSADPDRDEFRYSLSMLDRTGATNRQVTPTGEGLFRELDSLLWHMDEPFHGPSVYGQRKVHELARANGVIVLLDGQGGDEAFCGYHHFHYPSMLVDLLRRGHLIHFSRNVLARRRLLGVPVSRTLKDIARLWLRRGYQHRPKWLLPSAGPSQLPPAPTSLRGRHLFGLEVAPLPAFNHAEDRNSMTFSLEARNPFLDVGLVEEALALEAHELLSRGFTKWPLRQAMRDLLPPEIVNRAEKQGFTTDESDWLRERLGEEFQRVFASLDPSGRGLFDIQALDHALAAHRAGDEQAMELWRAYVTERWFRLFIDPETLAPPDRPETAIPSSASARDAVVFASDAITSSPAGSSTSTTRSPLRRGR